MNLPRLLTDLGQAVLRGVAQEATRRSRSSSDRRPTRRSSPDRPRRPRTGHARRTPNHSYPGDYAGPLRTEYAPNADGRPDPGEVCWAWVPYEEDHSRGKDRPVLVVGQSGPWLLALPLTSKDHDRDLRQETAAGRHWMDVGSGAWDRSGRPSEVRLDRVLRLSPSTVRREGSALERATFTRVVAAASRLR